MADLLGGALSAVGLGGVNGNQPTATTPVEPIAPTTPPQPALEPSIASKPDETSLSTATATESTLTQIATPTSQIKPTTITVTGEATATSTSTFLPKQADSSNTGAIAAGVIACFAAAGIIIAIIVWRWRRKHKPERFQQLDETSTNVHSSPNTRKEAMPYSPDSIYPVEKLELQPVVHEMPDTSVRAEMDGGQRYHAYKPAFGKNGA